MRTAPAPPDRELWRCLSRMRAHKPNRKLAIPNIGMPTFRPDHSPLVADSEDPLVDASQLIPGLIVDLHYATADNTHRAIRSIRPVRAASCAGASPSD